MNDPTPTPRELDDLRREAKRLLRDARAGDSAALARLAAALPPGLGAADGPIRLTRVQWALARERGYPSWPALAAAVAPPTEDLAAAAARLARLAFGGGMQRPRRAEARALLASLPELARYDPETAALAGDLEALTKWLDAALDVRDAGRLRDGRPLLAWAAGGFAPAERKLAVMEALASRGAEVDQAHFADPPYQDAPLRPLYYAAGVAHDEAATRWLLARGADPNDNESLYHAVEGREFGVWEALVAAGARWTGCNALFRALDFDEPERAARALALGADPNERALGGTPLHHALIRGCRDEILDQLVEAGADPAAVDDHGVSVWRCARRHGAIRFAERLAAQGLAEPTGDPADRLAEAVAAADGAAARAALTEIPGGLAGLPPERLRQLPELAANGRIDAVRTMLELGWPVDAKGVWDASALNQAAFNGDDAMARLLLAYGARWDERHGYGGDVWGSCFWASANLGADARVGRWNEVAEALLEAGSPLPAESGGSDALQQFLADWSEANPDWPKSDSR